MNAPIQASEDYDDSQQKRQRVLDLVKLQRSEIERLLLMEQHAAALHERTRCGDLSPFHDEDLSTSTWSSSSFDSEREQLSHGSQDTLRRDGVPLAEPQLDATSLFNAGTELLLATEERSERVELECEADVSFASLVARYVVAAHMLWSHVDTAANEATLLLSKDL